MSSLGSWRSAISPMIGMVYDGTVPARLYVVWVCATDGDGEWADEAYDLLEKTEVDGRLLSESDDMDPGECDL